MGTDNIVFLEMIEWFDETGKELVHRIPEKGSGEIKWGAQLVVRESQAGVFFYNGLAYNAFGPGRHTLTTLNIPILTKILSLPWGFTSPLRAEVYMVSMKNFINLKWGTRDPVAFKDSKWGLIRLRAYGVFNLRVIQPVLFVNTIVGTQGIYTTDEIEEYLSRVIVSRLNDHLGEKLDTLLNLPSRYEELSQGLKTRLVQDFAHYGLALSNLYIVSITPPEEVQQAIDDQSRLAVFSDLDKLVKMKAAMALEKASQSTGEAGAGMGMGLGFMMPALFADQLKKSSADSKELLSCPECKNPISEETRFCPACGHQVVVFNQCPDCGKNLAPNAKFCSQCGHQVREKKSSPACPHCGTENLPNSVFCNLCGEKLEP